VSAREKVNILLVDDQPAKLMSYEVILKELDENLLKASSAREALGHLLKHDVAVVLVDVCMPELDGFELAEMIREHPRYRKTAMIFISAVHLTDFDRLRGYASGAVDYLPVPVVPEILRAKVAVFAELARKTRQLERLNEELERRVLDRTAALEASTLRLQDSEARLREADAHKNEFLAMLAHELRNPLAPIRNSAHILEIAAPGIPEVHTACAVIERQVRHMARMIDDLLDLSRIARGKTLLRTERLDLLPLIQQVVEDHRAVLQGGGLALQLVVHDKPLWVDCDPTRLSQMMGNLLHNAGKFSNPGGSVTVSVGREGGFAVLRVRDTGIGIDPELMARLFKVFHQAEQGLSRTHGGLGLGLALVKALAELHGGEVSASSGGPGQGAEFSIRLPLSPAATDVDSLPSPPMRHPVMRGMRVLLIEDNPDAAETLAAVLALSGFETQTAHSGEKGLETARQFRPHAVLCDIGLPGKLSGYDVAYELRKDPESKTMTLIALTGYGREEDRRLAIEAGFDLHITKPVHPQTLCETLAKLSALEDGSPKDGREKEADRARAQSAPGGVPTAGIRARQIGKPS
jgi:signal transduction histidine kinase